MFKKYEIKTTKVYRLSMNILIYNDIYIVPEFYNLYTAFLHVIKKFQKRANRMYMS